MQIRTFSGVLNAIYIVENEKKSFVPETWSGVLYFLVFYFILLHILRSDERQQYLNLRKI